MAVVGEAHIIVRALTDKVSGDIQRGFSGAGISGKKAGESMGQAFSRGFSKNLDANIFTRFSQGLQTMVPGAVKARTAVQMLTASSFTLGTMLTSIIGGIMSLIGALGAVGGSALGAGAGLISLGNIFGALGLAMISARLALNGVGKALAALNKTSGGGANAAADAAQREAAALRIQDAEQNLARVIEDNRQNLIDANNEVRDSQLKLNEAIKKGQEEIQQLGFDAEEAALAEGRASLELDKARETLARTQDLPPNSRARKEAELAFQEAELRLRQAKDRSADLNKEQDRLARTGVNGTDAVISANQKLAQSEANKAKAIRDAARKQADAENELAKARAAAATAGQSGGGGADPYAGLNQFQIEFVNFLQGLKPKLEEVKTAISQAFLPPLQEAIGMLMADKPFTVFKDGLVGIAGALGQASKDVATAVTDARNLANLTTIFNSSTLIIGSLGRALASAWGAATTLLAGAAPLAENLAGKLEGALKTFDEFLKRAQTDGSLKKFFDDAGFSLGQLGTVIGNVLGGIGKIIMANIGPGTGGGNLLQFLADATQGFKDMSATATGPGSLRQYFLDVSANAQSVLTFIGQLVGELGKLGANKAIKETFDTLANNGFAKNLGEAATKALEAGPALADLAGKVADIINKFQDTGAIQIFFDTLSAAAGLLQDLLNNPVTNAILTVTGRIFAFGTAMKIMGDGASFVFKFLIGDVIAYANKIGDAIKAFEGFQAVTAAFKSDGFIGGLKKIGDQFGNTGSDKDKFIDNLGKLDGKSKETAGVVESSMGGSLQRIKDAFGKAGEGVKSFGSTVGTGLSAAVSGIGGMFSKLGGALASFGRMLGTFMLSPAGIVIGVIALIVGGLVLLYNTSEEFRTGMDAIFAQLGAAFADAGQQIMAAIQPLIPVLTGALQQIMTALAPVIPMLIGAFTQIVQAIVPLITMLISQLVPALVSLIPVLMPLVTMLISTLVPVIIQVVNAFVPLITMLVQSLVPVIIQVVNAFVPLITMLITSLVPVILTIIEAFVPLITLLLDALVPVITLVANVLVAIIPPIIQIVTTIIGILIPVFQFLIEVVVNVITGIINFIIGFVSFIIDAVTNIANFWTAIWTSIFDFIATIWNNIITWVTDAWNAIIGFLQPALDAFFGFWSNIFTNVGNFISDTWNNIVNFFRDGWNTVWTWISTAVKAYVDWWSGVFKAVGSFISDTWNNIVNFFKNGWNTVWTWISTAVKVYQDWWRGIFEGIGRVISDIWNNIVGFFKNGWNTANDWIRGAINGFVGFWKDAFNGIGNFVRDTFNGLIGILKGPINGIIDLLNGMINGLNKIKIDVPDWVPLIGGKTISFNVPNIPKLALGGVVSPTAGGTLAQIAEAGRPERVEPLDANGMSKRDKYMVDLIKAQGGAGTINITVNPSAGMDESELAAAISREITFQMRRGAVA